MGWLGKLFGLDGASAQPVSLDDTNFEREVVQSELPVWVDVWSPGCGPCKQLEPVVVDLARQYDGHVKVCELNAAASPNAAAQLGVRGTPTVLFVQGGRVVERVVGFRSSLYHKEAIEELFGVPAK